MVNKALNLFFFILSTKFTNYFEHHYILSHKQQRRIRKEMSKKSQRQSLLGKKLKKFNFVQKLGSGSYGTVYKAVNTKTDQIVAIKVMSKAQIKEIPKLQKLVKSQIAILQQVKNENVIKFVDSFSSNESIFIVTQFCNGGDLQKYCREHGKLNETEALTFLRQILNGFKGLHQINTMHRDFKLANVLLHNHVCKIADLGFAKQLRDKALTTTLLGTDETMAPQVHQGKQYGWGADIWSLGVVFYQMLYGRVPYSGVNQYAILRNIKTTKPNYSDVDISQEALDFLQRCLIADPDHRISWKQIYSHSLLYKSDITLTTGLLRSRVNFQSNKNYYEKNEDFQRKTIRKNEQQLTQNYTKTDKEIFQNAGDIKNADFRADMIRKNKQELEAEFIQYEMDIIHWRNNKMFGITQILPLQKQFKEIKILHSEPLYQISKNCYIQMKKLHEEITSTKQLTFKYWSQFKQQTIFKNICEQLFQDQIFAESLALGYKYDLRANSLYSQDKENINRKTDQKKFAELIANYRRQLIPHLKKQSKKVKPKFIKMLKALQLMQQNPSYDLQKFNQITDNLDVSKQEKELLNNS